MKRRSWKNKTKVQSTNRKIIEKYKIGIDFRIIPC